MSSSKAAATVEAMKPPMTSPLPSRMQPFGPNIWYVDGSSDVNFFGVLLPIRMVVVRLLERYHHHDDDRTDDDDGEGEASTARTSGSNEPCSWIWSPIEVSEELAREIVEVSGPVRYIVSPNKIHWLFLKGWSDRFPDARVYASPGLAERDIVRREGIKFDGTLASSGLFPYRDDIDQVVFKCSRWFEEVVFFHRQSNTVIFADLIQRHPPDRIKGFGGWVVEINGLVGAGGTPGDVRLMVWASGSMPQFRETLDVVLNQWQPDRLLVAHGLNAESDATAIVEHAFRWVPERPRNCACGCIPLLMCAFCRGDGDKAKIE